MEEAQQIEEVALRELATLDDSKGLDEWRVKYRGKAGQMTLLVRSIGALPKEERSEAGKKINLSRKSLSDALDARTADLAARERAARLAAAKADPTLPGVAIEMGNRHPIQVVMRDIRSIFKSMGFATAHGPEVELDEYNFELLNIPPDHPARDMWDTFYTTEGEVLRTHTSPVQVRAMRTHAPEPVKVICPGRVFRYEQVTARSESMFHQVEGLEVGPNVTMRDLLGVLQSFARKLFGDSRTIRVRNSFFPFTEPSIEVDVDCFNCESNGCSICKHTGWIEILGAGMVHPVVLTNGGYDPATMTGYAFGLGIERIAMLRYRIQDIRHFYRNDLRFLRQFQSA
jgi:phenylalanyl-tRNA synthetase alpha chain